LGIDARAECYWWKVEIDKSSAFHFEQHCIRRMKGREREAAGVSARARRGAREGEIHGVPGKLIESKSSRANLPGTPPNRSPFVPPTYLPVTMLVSSYHVRILVERNFFDLFSVTGFFLSVGFHVPVTCGKYGRTISGTIMQADVSFWIVSEGQKYSTEICPFRRTGSRSLSPSFRVFRVPIYSSAHVECA